MLRKGTICRLGKSEKHLGYGAWQIGKEDHSCLPGLKMGIGILHSLYCLMSSHCKVPAICHHCADKGTRTKVTK